MAVLSVFALAWADGRTAAEPPISALAETLAWLHGLPAMGGGVNTGLDRDRFQKLTLDDLKALKEVQIGGHLLNASGKTLPGHVTLPDADYRFLIALPELETLNCPENNLGDEALRQIGRIKTLRRLLLMENKFTAPALRHLAGLPNLTHLDLRWNKQLDDTAIPYLAQLKNVRELTLFQTNISPDGIKRLQESLPSCQIIVTKTDWR
jgi:hypothetical protein